MVSSSYRKSIVVADARSLSIASLSEAGTWADNSKKFITLKFNQLKTALVPSPSYTSLNLNYPAECKLGTRGVAYLDQLRMLTAIKNNISADL